MSCVPSLSVAGIARPQPASSVVEATHASTAAETRAAIGAIEPELSYEVPTLVSGGYLGSIEISAECTKDGSTGTCSVLFGPSLGTPSMNFATEGAVIEWD